MTFTRQRFGTSTSSRLPKRRMLWKYIAWVLLASMCVVQFGITLLLTWQFANNLPPRLAQGLGVLGWSPSAFYWFTTFTLVSLFASCFLVATAIFWLRPNDRMAVFTSVFLMAFGAANSYSPAPEYLTLMAALPFAVRLMAFIAGMLSFGLLAAFFAMFPDGAFVPRWMRWIAVEGFLLALAWNLFPQIVGNFTGPFGALALTAVIIMFGGSALAQIWRYRHYATPLQRQQTKWLVFGLALILAVLIVPSSVLYSLDTGDPKISVLVDLFVTAVNLVFVLLPVSIGIAILRYRLYDIDVIIRKTLVYSVLTVLLAVVFFAAIGLLQTVFGRVTGVQQSPLAVVISTLAIAALFTPLRRRIQNWLDRRFFRQKYDAQQVLARFAETARNETDLDALTAELARAAQETLQPDGVNVWLRPSERHSR